jgi:hypothetical protein
MKRAAELLQIGVFLILGLVILIDPAVGQTSPAVLPSAPGMYVATPNGLLKILGQIISFERTGSLLASGLTGGIVSRKGNVQLLGQHAQTETGPTPVFYFVPSKQEADAGGSGGDLVLVRAEANPGSMTTARRQFEISAEGYGRASKGISITHQIQLFRSEESPGVYKLAPAAPLSGGEYVLYLARGEGMAPYVYDFSVPGPGNPDTLNIVISGKSTVPAADILKKTQNCPVLSIIKEGSESESDYTLEAAESRPHHFDLLLFDPRGVKVFDATGDHLGATVDNLCQEITAGKIILGHFSAQSSKPAERAPSTSAAPVVVPPVSSIANASELATISVSSTPDGAEIYLDGAFIGNAQATLKLNAGKHTIKLTLAGYQDWSREVTALTGSEAHLTANFQNH